MLRALPLLLIGLSIFLAPLALTEDACAAPVVSDAHVWESIRVSDAAPNPNDWLHSTFDAPTDPCAAQTVEAELAEAQLTIAQLTPLPTLADRNISQTAGR